MPKRKLQNEDGAPSIYTFRLVNGESFDVQGVKVLVEQLVYKSIEYTNKKLLEGPPAPQIEEGAEASGEVREKGKIGRRRYSREEKKLMIGIYDKYPIKEAAMEVFENVLLFACEIYSKTNCSNVKLDHQQAGGLPARYAEHDPDLEAPQGPHEQEDGPTGGPGVRGGGAEGVRDRL